MLLLLLQLQLQLLQLDLALMQLWQGEWRLLLLSDYVIAVWVSVFFFSFTFVCDEKRFVFVLTQLSRPGAPPPIDGFVCSANVALRANLLQFLIVSERVRR